MRQPKICDFNLKKWYKQTNIEDVKKVSLDQLLILSYFQEGYLSIFLQKKKPVKRLVITGLHTVKRLFQICPNILPRF